MNKPETLKQLKFTNISNTLNMVQAFILIVLLVLNGK